VFSEIHRHLVLWKRVPDSSALLFRQIIVVEREKFEVRLFERDNFEQFPNVSDDASGTEILIHPSLDLAVLDAEKLFRQSVRSGWRAFDPTIPHYAAMVRAMTNTKPRVA
jgi:hypothetical protein